MALQGTIDAFPLADVLQLLSASSKTGRLRLSGDRGLITLWIDAGEVVGADSSSCGGAQAELLVFEMLRFGDGSFEFDGELGDRAPDHEVAPVAIAEALERALQLVETWSELEQVVPSSAHRVELVETLPAETVEIDAASWRVLTAAGSSVEELALRLDLDEFSATSLVADLVGAGLVELAAPIEVEAADLSLIADLGEPTTAPEPLDEHDAMHAELAQDEPEPDANGAVFPDRFPIDDLIGGDEHVEDDPWSSPEMERLQAQRFAAAQSFEPVEVEPLPLVDLGSPVDHDVDVAPEWDSGTGEPAVADEGTDEVLRQMSRLSPKAAEAIAAALNTVPGGEPTDGPDDQGGGITYSGSF